MTVGIRLHIAPDIFVSLQFEYPFHIRHWYSRCLRQSPYFPFQFITDASHLETVIRKMLLFLHLCIRFDFSVERTSTHNAKTAANE